ncbi:hypothetical protein GLOIN_2v1740240 [Rhizophagus irregularis DAOM 181602=DAOM 197198]|nr:hypothetical protein GLOIN_2v1740240 [Rhizophagus irregularis DAOM 181602=DAOM 197198]
MYGGIAFICLSIKRSGEKKCLAYFFYLPKHELWRKEFLLTREPLDIVRISTALFVRVEEAKRVGTAFEDLCSLSEMEALEPFRRYKLEQNHDVMEACKEFIRNEESKINMDDDLGNINYGEWLDKTEELHDLTKRMLESMLKIWKSPKYEAYIKKEKSINEGSYVCEVLAPLINIVMSDLPGKPTAWDIWGEEGSSASATRKGSRKIARRADYMMRQNLTIFTINIAGDVIELYAMRKESGIYNYLW